MLFACWLIGFLYPLIALASIYVCWLVAWVALGHQPREMLNDPKYIGGIMDVFYLVSVLLVIPWPILMVAGFFVTLACPIQPKQNGLVFAGTLIGLYSAMCGFAYWVLMVDPGRIFSWWCD